jgi:EAL domain-containing protein (putative c-di-GMP-specific phosphodiesterase class I)
MTDPAPVGRAQLLAPGAIRALYQPIVEIDTGVTVGYEALARWPGLDVTPDTAFSLATIGGYLEALDWACHRVAVEGALDARLGRDLGLFVNSEPSSFAKDLPAGFDQLVSRARRELRPVIEITERALTESPAQLLRACRTIREMGLGLALDDVGAVPESLALLPVIAPDVVKVDLRAMWAWSAADRAHFMTAIAAYAERSGGIVVAEGIESERHVRQARVLGATLGQGWYFGGAGPFSAQIPTGRLADFGEPSAPFASTPTALLEDSGRSQVAPKAQLVAMSRVLEQQAVNLQSPAVVLGAFQDPSHFLAGTAARYAELAVRCPLVVAFGAEMGDDQRLGFRTVTLQPDDPLRHEWVVVVLGSHYASALLARDLGDEGPDRDHRYEYLLTHDRDLVVRATASLLERVPPTQLITSGPRAAP